MLEIHAQQPDDPKWLTLAYQEVGTKEKEPGVNPRIVTYHSHTSLGATDDAVPWCSSFCCFIMDEEGITSPKSAASLSWLRWGRPIQVPKRGCLVIFNRLGPDGEILQNRGHVGFWLGETSTHIYVLGGNQSDKVGVNLYPKERLLGYRWPALRANSTTNMASGAAAVGTVVAAAPTVISILSNPEQSKEALSWFDKLSGFVLRLVENPSSILPLAGLFLVAAALMHIVGERNKKIKQYGI